MAARHPKQPQPQRTRLRSRAQRVPLKPSSCPGGRARLRHHAQRVPARHDGGLVDVARAGRVHRHQRMAGLVVRRAPLRLRRAHHPGAEQGPVVEPRAQERSRATSTCFWLLEGARERGWARPAVGARGVRCAASQQGRARGQLGRRRGRDAPRRAAQGGPWPQPHMAGPLVPHAEQTGGGGGERVHVVTAVHALAEKVDTNLH